MKVWNAIFKSATAQVARYISPINNTPRNYGQTSREVEGPENTTEARKRKATTYYKDQKFYLDKKGSAAESHSSSYEYCTHWYVVEHVHLSY